MSEKIRDSFSGDSKRIVLVGNPNVGKSVVFGNLTGKYVTVSNYPGTTVEVSRGSAFFSGQKFQIVDTPGVNTLTPLSEDEQVTRDILLNEDVLCTIQVGDSKNLRRALLISLQLSEMNIPYILALNMEDEARSKGIFIDTKTLETALGVHAISTVAIQNRGMGKLKNAVLAPSPQKTNINITYPQAIESGINRLLPLLPSNTKISRRSIALMLLSGDKSLTPWLIQHIPHNKLGEIDDIYLKTQRQLDAPSAGYLINITRLNKADELISRVLKIKSTPEHKTADRLSMLTIHPVYGLFILTCVLFLLYQFVGNLGAQVMVEFLEDNLFGKIISPTTTSLIDRLGVFLFGNTGASGSFYGFYLFMKDILVGKYGIVTMALSYSLAIIFPIVGTFFLAFSIMEDTGYLPRLAVMSNRVFKIMGLHGKAVLPMVLGLGCDTMATLTARIMSTRKERILVTLLLALGVPCSAQLGVIMGMLGKLGVRAFLIWIFVVLGVIFLVGYIASKILPGEKSDFVLEIPPLRIPQLKNIVVKTFARLEWYLKEAVPLFILGTLFLFFMDKFQLMDHIERAIEPVVKGLLGLPKEAAGAFLLGFLRRDYGATIIFDMARQGTMDRVQILVSLITITLFIPCVANLFIIIKERGFRVALAMTLFIFPFAFFTGWIVNILLRI